MTERGCLEYLVVDGHIHRVWQRREGKGKSDFTVET